MRELERLSELEALQGEEIGVGEWMEVTQHQIDLFADATGDHQWIHVDPERAAKGPFGATIAHGFLTLSLLPKLVESTLRVADVKMGVNYGLNRVRFTSPVPAGSMLRARTRLLKYEPLEVASGYGAQVTTEVTIEMKGADRPACVAESIGRRYA
ncbi:MAG: MaoC family dehydratase [Burkholderiaceae bacterium]|nr:MaoC family dehydratase [Burkholderiaceae bacterium]